MADITVKLFGVLRLDSKISGTSLKAQTVAQVFDALNVSINEAYAAKQSQALASGDPAPEKPKPVMPDDAVVFVNGERCRKRKYKLNDGDEVWLLSPASGG